MKTIVRWFRIALAAMVATSLASGITAAVAGERPTTHTVEIKDLQFHPQDLTISVGDTVVWKNLDAFAHTATATGRFDSHAIASKGSWKHTFKKAGVIGYACSVHPTMHGKLRVEKDT